MNPNIVNVNGLNYFRKVVGSGPPLVLLHGFTGASANWDDHVRALQTDFHITTLDLPGHGATDSPANPLRYGIARVASDLRELIKRRAPVNLLGYSMGGRLALYFALEYPSMVNKLILESASPGLKTSDERGDRVLADNTLARRIIDMGIQDFVDYWENIPLFESQKSIPQKAQLERRSQRLLNNPIGLANSLRGMGTGAQPSQWGRLADLAMPTLLITGERDPKFVAIAEEMQALSGKIEIVTVKNAGHTVHLERPSRFQKLVRDFINRADAET